MLKTLVYLLRPQMTSAFEVQVVMEDDMHGHVAGADVDKVSKFLRISQGVPQFELEYDGRLYQRCRLRDTAPGDTLPFSYESSTLLDHAKSDPNASYS